MQPSHKRGPTIGIVAICKNEERDLPGFFDNFLPWADEIIVVEDGSTDRSSTIIQAAGDKVRLVGHTMCPEAGFSGQRNVGIEHCSCDWLLHTDIDERVTPELVNEIFDVVKNVDVDACSYRRKNYFLHRAMRGGGLQDWNKPQLARKGKHHFENRVHEECVIAGGPENIHKLQSYMWHLNDENYVERVQKSVTYCSDQAEKIQEKGILIRWWHLILFPLIEFFKRYIIKRGFIDGTPGLIFALHSACAMFKAGAIVWDRQNCIPRSLIEKELAQRWTANRTS